MPYDCRQQTWPVHLTLLTGILSLAGGHNNAIGPSVAVEQLSVGNWSYIGHSKCITDGCGASCGKGANLVAGWFVMIPLRCVSSYSCVDYGGHRCAAWRTAISLTGLACKLRLRGCAR